MRRLLNQSAQASVTYSTRSTLCRYRKTMRQALLVVMVLSACRKDTEPRGSTNAQPTHDNTREDENHFFVASKLDRFEPSNIEVPLNVDLIMEFYFEDNSPCTGVVVQTDTGLVERTLASDAGSDSTKHVPREIDLHLRFSGGQHEIRCIGGTFRGTITAR